MAGSDLQIIGIAVDLIVILLAISLFVYALARGYLRSQAIPARGIILITGGMVLAMLAHISDPLVQVMQPAGAQPARVFASSFLPGEKLNWLLSRAAFGLVAIGLLIAVLHRKRLKSTISEARSLAAHAQQNEQLHEARLRYLFANTTDAVYCFRFDPPLPTDLPVEEQIQLSQAASLEDCNAVFARELDANDPAEVVGMRLGDLDRCKHKEAHEKCFRTFVQNGYELENYNLIYLDPEGNRQALFVNMRGDVRDGCLHRMCAIENSTLDMQVTKAKLERRDQFHALVANLSSRLVKVPYEKAEEEFRDCLADACRYFGAERSFIFNLNNDTRKAELAYFFSAAGNPFGKEIALDRFPEIVQRIKDKEDVLINDVSALPEELRKEKASFEQVGIKSLLVLPLTMGSDVVGGMTMGRIYEQRDWSEQDVKEVRVIAELFTSFVLRMKSRRELDQALEDLKHATERLEAENVYLREEIELSHGFDDIIGKSKAVLRSLQQVEQVAPTKATVLVFGETGTGKELIARALHELSDRKDRPLVKVNCAALPANLVESELFGYEKGAFTGADSAKRGRFDLADESTLFLDEIGEIPIELQAKLLRVLQEGEFERLGGSETVKVDVRLVVATNRDLAEAVAEGAFRSDLYYRINTFPIMLPPLRERGDDIQLLAEHFVKLHSPRFGRDIDEISAEMIRQLREYSWPGNVRELEGIVQRALISSQGPVLTLAEPLIKEAEPPRIIGTTIADLKLVERDHIVSVLEATNWKIAGHAGAASRLGIPPSTLRSKMKKLSIERPR